MTSPDDIERTLLTLVADRGPEKSICPSEVARSLAPADAPEQWRPLMTDVRRAAVRLAMAGRIDILRKGRPIDPALLHGVVRLRVRG